MYECTKKRFSDCPHNFITLSLSHCLTVSPSLPSLLCLTQCEPDCVSVWHCVSLFYLCLCQAARVSLAVSPSHSARPLPAEQQQLPLHGVSNRCTGFSLCMYSYIYFLCLSFSTHSHCHISGWSRSETMSLRKLSGWKQVSKQSYGFPAWNPIRVSYGNLI